MSNALQTNRRKIFQQILAMSLLLLFGGMSTISQNDYLQWSTEKFPNYENQIVTFSYPWFGNFIMFLGMSCAVFYWIYERKQHNENNEKQQKNSPKQTVCQSLLDNQWFCLIGSSIFDLVGSGLMSLGLNNGVSPSIYQILNGSIILFTPLMSWMFLKRKITANQGIGMAFVFVGIGIVALAGYFVQKYFSDQNQDDNHQSYSIQQIFLGIFLIILAQIIYSGQFILEEYTIQRLNCLASKVVFIEGIYGLLITLFLTMPINGLIGTENDFDAFVYIGKQPDILVPMCIFFVVVGLYNIFGQMITKMISANHRTIMEGLRALVVWIMALIERTIFGGTRGEGFYGWASAIQIVGFLIQLFGSLVFYNVINLKCKQRSKTTKQDEAQEEVNGLIDEPGVDDSTYASSTL